MCVYVNTSGKAEPVWCRDVGSEKALRVPSCTPRDDFGPAHFRDLAPFLTLVVSFAATNCRGLSQCLAKRVEHLTYQINNLDSSVKGPLSLQVRVGDSKVPCLYFNLVLMVVKSIVIAGTTGARTLPVQGESAAAR